MCVSNRLEVIVKALLQVQATEKPFNSPNLSHPQTVEFLISKCLPYYVNAYFLLFKPFWVFLFLPSFEEFVLLLSVQSWLEAMNSLGNDCALPPRNMPKLFSLPGSIRASVGLVFQPLHYASWLPSSCVCLYVLLLRGSFTEFPIG